jgi:hypothetical protein
VFSTPLTTAPFTRSAPTNSNSNTTRRTDGPGAVRRSDPPRAPAIDRGDQSEPTSREVMPAPSRSQSRTPGSYRNDGSSGPVDRVYRSPSAEAPSRPEPRGSAVQRSAPQAAPGGVPRGYDPGAARSAPSRVQPPPQQRSAPPSSAAPPSGGGSRSAPPASSSSGGRGRAVSRGGGR